MSRLILYSEQMLPETAPIDQRLVKLLAKESPQMGYIPSSAHPEQKYYRERVSYYAQYGISLPVCFELDQNYDPGKLDALLSCDGIHLSGGNTFYYLHWLKARGLIDPLREYAAKGGVLVGVSAGAILMTADIRTSLFCGDTQLEGIEDHAGLGLVDFAFVPHLGEIEANEEDIRAYAQQQRVTVYGCPDGSGIVIDGDRMECFGEMQVYRHA